MQHIADLPSVSGRDRVEAGHISLQAQVSLGMGCESEDVSVKHTEVYE